MTMYVVKRNGKKEKVSFDKVLEKYRKLSYGLKVSYEYIAQKTIEGIYDGVTTRELDVLASEIAASKIIEHPDYSILASRIVVSDIHKTVHKDFSANAKLLHEYIDPKTDEAAPLIADDVYKIIEKHKDELDAMIIHDRDFDYDYFGIKTLDRSYLLKRDKIISETPQFMLLRVALGIHKDDLEKVEESYNLMSKKFFTHATPTLFNSGTPKPQMSSCFLVAMKEDSIKGIYGTLAEVAEISQHAGGIGVHIHNIRSKGSYIKGTGGVSNGLVPMLKVYNETANYVDQGGGKRKGSFAMYLEPWHADIFDFLDLKKNTGKEEFRARDLFYAMWVPDLFMERVKKGGEWSLMDPNVSRGLSDVYGDDFNKLYEKYEKEGKFVKQIKAQDLWFKIVESQIETGNPYVVYKDSINRKTNHQNLGVIKSSNLCAEIAEYSDKDNTAVCNLASISLPHFLSKDNKTFDFDKLAEITKVVVNNIDTLIDVAHYVDEPTKNSNMNTRPMGIGIQGLADVFARMKFPFNSEEAMKLNREIYETIYFASVDKSADLAKERGEYPAFKGSPSSKGILQPDMWEQDGREVVYSGKWDWKKLKEKVKKQGLRNSLFIAQMPTGSTAQILGNNESFEPFTSNVYLRRTLSGEFIVVNKHLLQDLIDLGIWDQDLKNAIMANNGSIQNIDGIPDQLKAVYKTVWEISQKTILKQSADRSPFVDQTQSLNIHMVNATLPKVTSMHFYGWELGLKTGMYYLRTQSARDAIKFTVDISKTNTKSTGDDGDKKDVPMPKELESDIKEKVQANIHIIDDDDPGICLSCGA